MKYNKNKRFIYTVLYRFEICINCEFQCTDSTTKILLKFIPHVNAPIQHLIIFSFPQLLTRTYVSSQS